MAIPARQPSILTWRTDMTDTRTTAQVLAEQQQLDECWTLYLGNYWTYEGGINML